MPSARRTRVLRRMWNIALVGGSRALAVFHEYPLGSSEGMVAGSTPWASFTSSFRGCRIEALLALIPSVLLRSRVVFNGGDWEASLGGCVEGDYESGGCGSRRERGRVAVQRPRGNGQTCHIEWEEGHREETTRVQCERWTQWVKRQQRQHDG